MILVRWGEMTRHCSGASHDAPGKPDRHTENDPFRQCWPSFAGKSSHPKSPGGQAGLLRLSVGLADPLRRAPYDSSPIPAGAFGTEAATRAASATRAETPAGAALVVLVTNR